MRKLLYFLSCLLVINLAFAEGLPSKYSEKLIFFGDSLTDVGNKVVQVDPENRCKEVSAPVTNTTPTNGAQFFSKLWSSSQTVVGVPPFNFVSTPSKNGGNNYAVAGATFLNYPFRGAAPQNIIDEQVKSFLQRNHNRADPSKLYAIWGGANDILDTIEQSQITHPNNPAQLAIDLQYTVTDAIFTLQLQLNRLADAGARNFLIIGLPDLAKTPAGQCNFNPEQQAAIRQVILGWNGLLQSRLRHWLSLQQKFNHRSNIQVYFFNPQPIFDEVVAQPENFGFLKFINGTPNNQVFWCKQQGENTDNPDNFLFFNGIHPTSRLHNLLAGYVVTDSVQLQPGKAIVTNKK